MRSLSCPPTPTNPVRVSSISASVASVWLFLLTYTLVHLRLATSTASQSCKNKKRQVCPHAAPAKAPDSFEQLVLVVKEAGTQAPTAPHHAIAAMAMARSKQNVEPAMERARCRIHRLKSILAWGQDPRRLIGLRPRDSWPTRTFLSAPGFVLIGRGARYLNQSLDMGQI